MVLCDRSPEERWTWLCNGAAFKSNGCSKKGGVTDDVFIGNNRKSVSADVHSGRGLFDVRATGCNAAARYRDTGTAGIDADRRVLRKNRRRRSGFTGMDNVYRTVAAAGGKKYRSYIVQTIGSSGCKYNQSLRSVGSGGGRNELLLHRGATEHAISRSGHDHIDATDRGIGPIWVRKAGAAAGVSRSKLRGERVADSKLFRGPPSFTPIDVGMVDFDVRTGELWFPAGLYLSQYTEIICVYNSGFDPLRMPNAIRHATASLVRNLLSRGGGATGLKSFSAGRIRAEFTDDLIDVNIQNMLLAYKTVRTG